eukprot:scaffold576_cov260-Pinguiococcus_pyrenoidosus.AAC.41
MDSARKRNSRLIRCVPLSQPFESRSTPPAAFAICSSTSSSVCAAFLGSQRRSRRLEGRGGRKRPVTSLAEVPVAVGASKAGWRGPGPCKARVPKLNSPWETRRRPGSARATPARCAC